MAYGQLVTTSSDGRLARLRFGSSVARNVRAVHREVFSRKNICCFDLPLFKFQIFHTSKHLIMASNTEEVVHHYSRCREISSIRTTRTCRPRISLSFAVVVAALAFFRGSQSNNLTSPLAMDAFSTTNTDHKQKNRVGELAKAFEHVLKGRGLTCDVDTLRFLRACRKFEFLMREIGQRQAAKDMEGNIQKVLVVYYVAPPHRRKTVSQLLEYEKSMGIHRPYGHLKDPSAAMGLLWIRRSLSFQARMYTLLLEPDKDPSEAALVAYRSELEPYHGWALQRLYKLSLRTATQCRHEVLAKLGGVESTNFGEVEEQATLSDLRLLLQTWKPLIFRCRQIYAALDIEDKRRV